MPGKYVYLFLPDRVDGNASMRELLGGKGALLAELVRLQLPVPAGFTITTDACRRYLADGDVFLETLRPEVEAAMQAIEQATGLRYGDPDRPLLVSCRSGARQSMPGMMETVLNVGLCSETIRGLVTTTQNKQFVYDAYRRLIMMYSDVVMEKATGEEVREGMGIRVQLEKMMQGLKTFRMCKVDTELRGDDLEQLAEAFKAKVAEVLGDEFPDDPQVQLWHSIAAVFKSWNGRRAAAYRRLEGIPDQWGTACTVQSMKFGNKGADSATGVCFTRNPATGKNVFFGEWLPVAQGEDVVAGVRTPHPLNEDTRCEITSAAARKLPTLEEAHPVLYQQLLDTREKLEGHFQDMQDLEFSIEDGALYILQCRTGKRTGTAALNMAMDMWSQGLIDEEMAVSRVDPNQLDELLHPVIQPETVADIEPLAEGLPAGPGAVVGRIVFNSEDALRFLAENETRAESERQGIILVREETNPDDIEGMRAATGILTSRGGMVCHAALVVRGWGKCCIVGATALQIDPANKTLSVGNSLYHEGDLLTLDGTRGLVYPGAVPLADATGNPRLQDFMERVDRYRKMGVRANAETVDDVARARELGADGVGLFRMEHMFYGQGSEEPLFLLRKMILAQGPPQRNRALEQLFPFFKESTKSCLAAMAGLPVTIRLLDPPLHEFLPKKTADRECLARELGQSVADLKKRCDSLHETNPMMGHRGVRLGITAPDITEFQLRAILEGAAELAADGVNAMPEIMVPVTTDLTELLIVKKSLDQVRLDIARRIGDVDCRFGTMIETPRACIQADRFAECVEFFSFGTNDLTQLVFAFSRDDVDRFLSQYLNDGILRSDPFEVIDTAVIRLMEIAIEKGRSTRPGLKIGLCGEHGGNPASIALCGELGLDYVSCSVARLPVARLAAAHSAVNSRK